MQKIEEGVIKLGKDTAWLNQQLLIEIEKTCWANRSLERKENEDMHMPSKQTKQKIVSNYVWIRRCFASAHFT